MDNNNENGEYEKLESFKKLRAKQLGFMPQNEIFCNSFLPYAEVLDRESQEAIEYIKQNLGLAVSHRDINLAVLFVNKLVNYLKLYGFKFSKDDHVLFIKLLMKIIEIRHLDPPKLNKCCVCLVQLFKKSHLLSPEDLEIDWRPLYLLCKIYIDKRSSKGDLIRCYPTLEHNIIQLLKLCSFYYPKSANQEIFDELLPQVLPLDIGKVDSAVELLVLFINTSHHENWFKTIMDIWNTYHYPCWNSEIMDLVASTASQNIGYIDWSPYIPIMFTRILRALDLPVSYKQIKSSRSQSMSMNSSATWIISVIGPKYDTMKYLKSLFSTIESYLNPANSGKWVKVISDLLVNLVQFFQDRLVSERYKRHPWRKQIPDEYKIRDEDITEFVEAFKPIAMTIIYSRMLSYDITKILKGLADLRPELILPEIIEKVSTTAELINEPNKFTASLNCLSAVASSLVTNKKYCTGTKTEIIPIMFSILPGIDSNDFRKTSITLHFLMTVSFLIPFIDCSKASLVRDDLNEDEILISEQTAQFEDFILQFLDRIFVLIETSSVENIRMEHASNDNEAKSKLESIAEILIQNTSHSILSQCSQEILSSASKKMINYVKNNALEPRVAGTAISILCKVFARVNPKEMYHSLIPFIVEVIETHFNEFDDAFIIEKQNDDFLYYVQILTNMIRGDPIEIQKYIDTLLPIIDKLLKCKCKSTNRNGANIIGGLLNILSVIQICDVKTVPEAYEKPLEEFLPIRHWGRKMNRDEKFEWFIPSENERIICEKIIHYYLLPILDKFEKYLNGSITICRDDMLLDLCIISSILKCNNFLDNWDEEPIKLLDFDDTNVEWKPFKLTLGYENLCVNMPNGSNIRKTIVDILEKLQNKLIVDSEDDIKSFKQLISIWEKIHMKMNSAQGYDSQIKNYQMSKKFQEYKLCKVRKDIRAINATRVVVQHDLRDELTKPSFTPTHRRIMINLIKLSTSHYSVVRSLAQMKLFKMFTTYSFSYKSVVDDIVEYLKLDPNENHESFKGALYLIGTNRRHRLLLRSDWETVEKLWIPFMKTKLSEKLSIIRIMESITDGINNEFQTVATEIHIDESLAKFGASMVIDKSKLNEDYLLRGEKKLKMLNEKNESCYQRIIHEILTYYQENSLHWRYSLLCGTLINDLVHPVSKYPLLVSEIYCKNLIHESINERMLALKICSTVLKQQKREHIKIAINPYQYTNETRKNGVCVPGLRKDNQWLQYDINTVPKNQIEWDEPRYTYKINGFFGWTPVVEIYAPSSMQPKLDRSFSELNDHEKVFYSFFKDPKNLEKLIYYWSMEEKKGSEKFHRSRFWLIKQIFGIFGDIFLDDFLSYMEPLIINQKSESSHRCAAEILTGIMRGAKHWNYEKTKNLYEKITPLIKLALKCVTPETDSIWGCAFATASESMDPSKQYFLHELLLDNPIRDVKSFTDCSRLYCLQGAFNQHAWRMISVGRRLINYLDPFLNHPFQNVRDRIGSTLINIFENDLDFEEYQKGVVPRLKEFLEHKSHDIQLLLNDENSNHVIETNTPYAASIRFFKTISQFLIGVLNRSTDGNESIYTVLLPIAIRLEKCEYDVELAQVCTAVLALIAQAFTQPSRMNDFLVKIEDISRHSSWQCRLSAIDILQVLIFNNMPIVISQAAWIDLIQSIVLRLLEDNMVEVREKAAEVLGGLIHCSFLTATDKLLEQFKKKCQTKIVKRNTMSSIEPNIKVRHSGVLGLCAFITAFPYEIPNFVPNVFEILHKHLDDPQPIPSTIRKTLADFKRTHHDGWDFHQLKFTESQLAVLSDLSVPPSYFN